MDVTFDVVSLSQVTRPQKLMAAVVNTLTESMDEVMQAAAASATSSAPRAATGRVIDSRA